MFRQSEQSSHQEPLLSVFPKEKPKENPLDTASFFSKLFFLWINPLLKQGQATFLQKEMLYPVQSNYDSEKLLQRFSTHWPAYSTRKLAVLRVLFRVFRREIVTLLILSVINSILVFANPIIINRVIVFAESEDKPVEIAIILLVSIFISKFLAVLASTITDFRSHCLGIHVISTLSMRIYEKCLRFSLLRSRDYNEGKLVNIVQTDLNVIIFLFDNLFSIIFLPLQIIVGLLIMYIYVDIAFLAGLAVIILMSVINYLTGKVYIKYQEKLMSCKDERSKATNELLNGIKHIKMSAQEYVSWQKLAACRRKELAILMRQRALDAFYILIFWITPMLVTTFTFLVFIIMGNQIDALKAFTVVSLFQALSGPLVQFPYSIADLINCFISTGRIEKFLLQEEINEEYVICEGDGENYAIVVKNGTFYWENKELSRENAQEESKANEKMREDMPININYESIIEENQEIHEDMSKTKENPENNAIDNFPSNSTIPATLRNISLSIPKGSFIAIVGSIGSGKSSIFHAVLNEMRQEPPPCFLSITGSLGYTSQKPWIQTLTIKENILFGHEFRLEKYEKIKKITCLEEDLKLLKHGDATMIGDKGINLSGGQKARLSLARALYAEKDVYLFDDILAAVDAHVGKTIFLECFLKFLRKKTRILITHALYYLEHVDFIYVLDKGTVVEQGSFQEIKNSQVLAEILKKFEEDKSFASQNREDFLEFHADVEKKPENPQENCEFPAISAETREVSQNCSVFLNESSQFPVQSSEKYGKILDDLILEEDRQYGRVSFSDIRAYIRYNGGFFFIFLVVFVMFVWVCLELGSNLWLKYWIDSNDPSNNSFYIKIYAVFALTYAFCCAGRALILFTGSYFCSLRLHNNIIKSLLLAPLNEFFDRVPLGRVLNRLSKDLYNVDVELSFTIGSFLVILYSLLAELGLCVYAIRYWVVIPFVVMTGFMLKVQGIYMKCNRELVRLEAISKSPVVSFFTETLGGLSIIRAFAQRARFLATHAGNVNENLRTLVVKYAFDQWFTQRIAFISFILVMTITALALFWEFQASFAGLLLYYIFQIELDIRYFISCLSQTECIMISFERCHTLTQILPEKGYNSAELSEKPWFSHKIPEETLELWPNQGKIQFRGVDVKYRENLDFVLKNVSFSVENNEKIGVVGRTGAGKSTLILSLLRILEPVRGEILIDGINIKELDLRDLRKKITVIPQDVYLFEGSLRENLDPHHEFSEEFLWQCLENVTLRESFEKKPGGIHTQIKEMGANLSAGEKQLISLCRAFLRRNKVILIDEATANIDLKTEKIIQEVIREKFKDFTVLTIAHRINTILHNDRILVLDKGMVVEFDRPEVLLEDQKSAFFALWKDSLAGITY